MSFLRRTRLDLGRGSKDRGAGRAPRILLPLSRKRTPVRPRQPAVLDGPMNSSPYEAARIAGRREARDEIRQLLSAIYAVTETREGRDAIWSAIEQLDDVP